MENKESNEFTEVGIAEHTVLRLYDGWLEFREEYGDKARKALKALKVKVLGEEEDYQIISLKELKQYKDEDFIKKKETKPFKPDYRLYRFKWKPFQEIGHLITVIEKDRTWQYMG
jgi:hypothetical protein